MNVPTSQIAQLAKPGHNCWRVEPASRVAFIIDTENYYRALAESFARAEREIAIVGWDVNSRARLIEDGGAEGLPSELGPMLDALANRKRRLHVWVLEWDFPMLYALDRELLPLVQFGWRTHRRVHFRLDSSHPLGGSHHQKMVIVDGKIAFVGGMDVTHGRWDTCEHRADDPRRIDPWGRRYPPYHDVQVLCDGAAAAALAKLARERWKRWIDMVMPDSALIDPERPVGMNDLIAELAPNDLASLRSPLERTAIAIAAIAGVTALWWVMPASARTTAFGIDAWLAPWRDSMVAPLVASASVALGGMSMAPLALLTALCGFVFGPWIGFAAAFSGALAGALAGHALGARLSRETIRRLVGRGVDRLSRQLRAGGLQAMFAMRLLPLAPFAAVNVVAGAIRFPLRDFLLGTLCAMAPTTLALAVIGDAAADAIRNYGSRALAGATAIALAMIAAMLGIRRQVRARARERRAIA